MHVFSPFHDTVQVVQTYSYGGLNWFVWTFTGVDFQVKSIVMEGQVIVLQLWDTAGQER